jgi:hypothetical protein
LGLFVTLAGRRREAGVILEELLAGSVREIERPLLVKEGVRRPQGVIWN